MSVVGMAGSPRRGGNSDTLLDWFLSAVPPSHQIKRLVVPTTIKPCLGCDLCKSGRCIQDDIMQTIYPVLDEAQYLILSAPIYFYGLPSHVAAMIDRGQLFFNRPETAGTRKRGVFLSSAATHGPRLFDGPILSLKYWFRAMGCEYVGEAVFRGVDQKGDILGVPGAKEEVLELAKRLFEK